MLEKLLILQRGRGEAISEMAGTVSHISEMSIQIAAAVEQQSCTTEGINRNIAAIGIVAEGVEKSCSKVKESGKYCISTRSRAGNTGEQI